MKKNVLKYFSMGKNKNKKNFNKKPEQQNAYTPKGKKEDLDRPIEDLQLSKNTFNALKGGGIKTLRQLCMLKMSKMYRIRFIGKKECLEIAEKLKKFNLHFRPEDQQTPQQVNNNPHPAKKEKNNRDNVRVIFSIFDDKQLVQFIAGERQREIFHWEDERIPKREINKFCRNGKWGYKDQKGNTIIQPTYDEAFNFSEGFACVEKNSKLGYIDKTGKQIVDFIYDCAASFSDGLACVTKDDKSGYIDCEGNVVFELQYEKATSFKDGKALIKQDGKWRILQKDGNVYWR